MKKHLLTTSALVAAGTIAAASGAYAQGGPKLMLDGYMWQAFGAAFGNDEDVVGDRVTFDVHSDTEIQFIGTAKLDNGISFRAVVELEGNTSSDQIDESYLIIRGSFGQITIGSEDNAAHLMTIGYLGSWAVGVGQNLTFDAGDYVQAPAGFGNAAGGHFDPRLTVLDNDAEKLTYYTPRFAGFQLGASYIPNVEQDASGSLATTGSVYNHGFAVGLNFDRKFDNIGVGIGFGWLHWSGAEAAGAFNDDSADAWIVSARLDFGGFRIAGGYKRQSDDLRLSATESGEAKVWDVGGRYMWGPNAVSLSFVRAATEASTADPDEDVRRVFQASYRRTLGPGINWNLNFWWIDHEAETGVENDGFAITTQIQLFF